MILGLMCLVPPLSHHLNIHLIKSLLNLNKSALDLFYRNDKIGFFVKKRILRYFTELVEDSGICGKL